MKTELIDKGNLSSQLTIVLEPQDYKPTFESEIRKYSQKVHLKGFRKGKTPLSAVKKMYGKSVLADVINNKIQATLEKVIVDEQLDILGNPLPSEDQKMVDFDIKNLEPMEFQFDLGLAPKIMVKGTEESDIYDEYQISIGDEDINKSMEDLQKRMGEQVDVEGPCEDLDILTLRIKEVNPENEIPFETDITIMPDRMNDAYKSDFLDQNIGYSQEVNIYDLEKDASEDYVQKYFLKDAPEHTSKVFHATIKSIKRLVPATIEGEFFEKAFGPDSGIETEEDVREKIRLDLQKFYNEQSHSITKRKILESIVEHNDIDLPDEFLKRWLLASNKDLTEEQLETEYDGFVQNLKWTLIKKELNQKYEIDVTADDIKQAMIEKFKAQFAQYGYGQMGDLDYEGIAARMMQNEESVQKEYEEILAERIMDKVLEAVTLKEKKISTDEYQKIVEEMNQNKG